MFFQSQVGYLFTKKYIFYFVKYEIRFDKSLDTKENHRKRT